MPKHSAGILLYRRGEEGLEVLLVHPGGPFWKKRDAGAWSIPKGEVEPDEPYLDAASRELQEETGFVVETGGALELTPVRYKAGKVVHAFAVEGDCDPATVRSTTFSLEWPPRSGKMCEFPEIDRAEFFPLRNAREKILPAQVLLLDELERLLARRDG